MLDPFKCQTSNQHRVGSSKLNTLDFHTDGGMYSLLFFLVSVLMLRVSCQFRVKTLVPRFTHSFSSNSTAAATATLTSEGEVEEAGEYKPPIALVARLRKDTQCSLQKARAALVATRGGLDEAREWLAQESAVSAAGKAQKLENRSAREVGGCGQRERETVWLGDCETNSPTR